MYSTFNNTHYSNCLFHAYNIPLIKHYLPVTLLTSTLSLTNNFTQCTAGAVIAPLSKLCNLCRAVCKYINIQMFINDLYNAITNSQ